MSPLCLPLPTLHTLCPIDSSATAAPVDCALSRWISVGHCSRACGGGKLKQIRQVLQQPRYGGHPVSSPGSAPFHQTHLFLRCIF